MTYIPYFKCKYCGEVTKSLVSGDGTGLFIPCQCEEARNRRDQDHYLEMERRKRARRGK